MKMRNKVEDKKYYKMVVEEITLILEGIVNLIGLGGIVYGGEVYPEPLQNGNKIYLNYKRNSPILVHEIGHWIAATDRELGFHNLGLTDDYRETINREIQAREISKYLFWDWSYKIDPCDSFRMGKYIRYLCESIFSGSEHLYNDVEITEEWIRDKIQKRTGLSPDFIKSELDRLTNDIFLDLYHRLPSDSEIEIEI
jgi:hypothetical protein